MAISGSYIDHQQNVFQETLLRESQFASVLSQTVINEPAEGKQAFFDILGKFAPPAESTGRLSAKTYEDQTYQRRGVIPTWFTKSVGFDIKDLAKFASDPRSPIVQNMVEAMGRQKDKAIADALKATVTIYENDTSGTASLSLTVAVGSNIYTNNGETGNTGLTVSKIKEARAKLIAGNSIMPGQKMFVVGSINQIMNLTKNDQMVNAFYRSGKPLEGAGVVQELSGFLGCEFIQYEGFANVTTGVNAVYVYVPEALKFKTWTPLTVKMWAETPHLELNSPSVDVFEGYGVVRAYEDKVVQIACDDLV